MFRTESRSHSLSIVLEMLFAAVVLLALAAAACAEIPKKITYQGRLIDTAGLPLAGSHSLTFSIYDASTGGTALWTETKTETADSSGVFSTLLGSVSPIEVDFAAQCWLEVEVDGETLSPRREIVSVPYAYQAASAAQAYEADHAALADSASTTAEASNAAMLGGRPAEAFADSSVDGHSLDAADGNPEDAVYVDNAGRVGVATTTPNGPLQVESNISINNTGATNFTNRIAPVVIGDGDGTGPCILIDGNQIEQANPPSDLYLNYNSSGNVVIAQGGGNVGVGTASPGAKLEVAGQMKISAAAGGPGLLLASGYEGIGTSTPNGPLHVESGLSVASGSNLANRVAPVVVGDGDGTAACLLIDGNQIDQADPSSVLHLNLTSPAKVAIANGGGNVGIGTVNPDAKLEVAGQVKITGGSPGAGKVLSSDAGGLASWQAMDVEYMVNPADNALARLSGESAQGYYEGRYFITAHSVPLSISLAIPIHLQSRVGGVPQKIKSLKVYYRACTDSKINATRIQMMDNAGGDFSVINDTTDRTSTAWASYTVTDPSPDPITGVVTVWLDLYLDGAGCMNFESIILTTGP